ncbi:hypothetical protein CDD83_5677 [Cordyceps sp. RAO-2017]|nr:hypothetical protein CDD83_5677 [Cordyceps sp. RAO-2017]
MFLLRRSRLLLRRQVQAPRALGRVAVARAGGGGGVVRGAAAARRFSQSARLCAVKPVLLADIGEGIVECEVIQWFVEPGARVEEFSPLCEVQSDKASVEITSRFAGTVKKLYYEAGEMARVGKPFVDIDIEGPAPAAEAEEPARQDEAKTVPMPTEQTAGQALSPMPGPAEGTAKAKGKMAGLATPAVRHLSKELKVDIGDVDGTGRDGRVLKEDIHKFVQAREAGQTAGPPAAGQGEYRVPLGATQQHMFKTMTRSLAIPHFLYADEIDFTGLTELRARLNRVLAAQRCRWRCTASRC